MHLFSPLCILDSLVVHFLSEVVVEQQIAYTLYEKEAIFF